VLGFFVSGGSANAGGEPLMLCDLQNQRGISWGPGDMIVFADNASPGIWQVSASGGTPKRLIAPDPEKAELFYGPELLPGGKAVPIPWGHGRRFMVEPPPFLFLNCGTHSEFHLNS